MSENALLRIGEFSRASWLSVKALRAYHESGLLVPVEVAPATFFNGAVAREARRRSHAALPTASAAASTSVSLMPPTRSPARASTARRGSRPDRRCRPGRRGLGAGVDAVGVDATARAARVPSARAGTSHSTSDTVPSQRLASTQRAIDELTRAVASLQPADDGGVGELGQHGAVLGQHLADDVGMAAVEHRPHRLERQVERRVRRSVVG